MNPNHSLSLTLSLFLLFTIVSCGGGGGGGGSSEPPVPAATITLSISDNQIYLGSSATISWSTSNATSCSASGSWSGSKALSGSETVTPETAGGKSYTLSCSNSAGTSTSRTVSTNVIGNAQGVVIGANYISNSTVGLDLNSNYEIEDGEPSTTTDSNGIFELPDDPQDIISIGGSDSASGNSFENLSLSHKSSTSASRVISALTSLNYANSGSTDINNLLNLDSTIDIHSTNPIAVKGTDSNSNKYYEINTQIFILTYSLQAFVNETNSSSLNSKTFYESLYSTLQQSFDSGTQDLSEHIETTTFIDVYVDKVLSDNNISFSASDSLIISSSLESDLKSILQPLIEKISVRNSSSVTEAISNYATGTFISDIIALANGSIDPTRVASYSSNINSLISSDQNIDESLLDQSISLIDDSVSIDEDNVVEISPLSNDVIEAGNDYYGLSISISSPDNGQASLDESNNITYTPNDNFFGSDNFIYTVNVDGTSATANIDVDVVSVNDPPTFKDFISTSSIDENILNVLTVTVEDIEGDSIGFSLSGNDADKLSISTSGSISFKSNPDFEAPNDSNSDNVYEITIEASDGVDTVTEDLVITILDVQNEGNPIIEGLSSLSVNENETISISFTVSDPQDDAISYSLSGVDKDLFTLNFDGSNATLTSGSKDYELPEDSDGNNVYLISVNFSDDLNTSTQEVEIAVNNLNDNTPSISSNSNFLVDENQATIGDIIASDADNDSLSYSISGTDASAVYVSSSGQLYFNGLPNYEQVNIYNFTVTVTDGLYSANQNIVVNINDVNDAPFWKAYSSYKEVDENISSARSLLTFEVSDEDSTDFISYTLSGVDGDLFCTSGKFPGPVNFCDDDGPDFENPKDSNGDNTYNFFVTATDGTVSITTAEISIVVKNINDNAPIFVDLATNVEVTNGQSNVFDISTSDADGDNVTLSASGTDSSKFNISDSNNLSFISAPDFSNPTDSDGDNVYKLNIVASDDLYSTNSDEISITVLEVNNPPVINDLQTSYSIDENIEEIDTFSVTDPEGNTITVGVSGDDSSGFTIENNTLKYSGGANFENPTDSNNDNTYNLIVFADDGFNRTEQNVDVTIVNVDEGPEFSITSEISVDENERIITSISVSDPEGDSFTWDSLPAGTDASLFRYFGTNPSTKNLGFNDFNGADYEDPLDENGDNVYELELRAVEDKASGIETILNLRITINDLKDTWAISGTIYSNPFTLIDGDVPDIIDYPPVPNNDVSSAQTILNPTDVIGHIGDNVETVVVLGDDGFCVEDPENPGYCLTEDVSNVDPEDWYKFTAAPNLLLTLSIEGLIFEQDGSFYCCTTDNLDADLLIYNEDGTLANFDYASSSTSTYKQIVLPSSGTYYAVVKAVTGHTKYVLTLGSNATGISSLSNPEDQYAKNRFISYIPFGPNFNANEYTKPQYDNFNNDLSLKLIQSDDYRISGLRVIDFDLETEFNKIFKDDYMIDSSNYSQVNYLKHWKLLQHYKNLYPRLNLELDFKYQSHFSQDPSWAYQWGLQQIGLDTVLTAIGQNVKDVAVAVLDSGSPATTSTAWTTSAFVEGGYDFTPFENSGDGDGYDPDPTDTYAASDSHGTHVATTISALNDGLNINGFGIQTVPVRVLGADGTGYNSDIAQGLLYAAGLPNGSGQVYSGSVPIKVINMSLGSVGGGCGSTFQNAINDVYATGITIVSSSGNSAQEAPGSYGYPASCNNVISVGALDYVKGRAYYSTYNDQVDIAAPGGDLTADINADGYGDGILAFVSNEDLGFFQGTSMASPHVAGAIAVLYALVPTLQPFQVEGLLVDGHLTDDIGDEGKDDNFGYGALNLQKAVNRIISDEGLDFTYGTVDPGSYNLGKEFNSFNFNINKVGDGELSVTSVESNIPSALTISSSEIDSEGFGSYILSIDRTDLPDGLYQANIKIVFSNENTSQIALSFQVGDDRERIPVNRLYAELRDDGGESIVWGRLSLPEGEASFTAESIPLGNYYWLFSTTTDAFILDPAEFYNYYPDASSPDDYFTLGENDIENSAVTLRVNKSTAGFSMNKKTPVRLKSIKVEDFNASRIIQNN